MDELLKALRLGDAKAIRDLATELLVTQDNQLNRPQADEFERYAPCRINPQSHDIYHSRCYVGTIEYNRAIYSF